MGTEMESGGVGLNFAYPTISVQGCKVLVAYSILRHGHRGRIPITKSGIKGHIVYLPEGKSVPSGMTSTTSSTLPSHGAQYSLKLRLPCGWMIEILRTQKSLQTMPWRS